MNMTAIIITAIICVTVAYISTHQKNEKSEKICDVVNYYGVPVKEIHIGKNGTLFTCGKKTSEIEVVDQESAKEYIGKRYPEKYLKYFGEVEEA